MVLRHRAPGYVLELSPEQVDVHRFEQLFSTGRRFLARQDPVAARDRLTRALGLWRGSPYAEFVTHQPLADESTRLEQVRLTALEACAEAGLVLGRTAEVVTELEREVRQHPTRERLVGHLMTALFRSGRQAEALEVYEWTRSYLVEEYGVDTTAELQQLHTALLRQELGEQRTRAVLSDELLTRAAELPGPSGPCCPARRSRWRRCPPGPRRPPCAVWASRRSRTVRHGSLPWPPGSPSSSPCRPRR